MTKIYRPPQGKFNTENLSQAQMLGYKTVFWSLAYADWDLDNQKGSQYAHDTVISRIHPGAVLGRAPLPLQGEAWTFPWTALRFGI